MSALDTSIQHCTGESSQCNKAGKKKLKAQTGRVVRLPLFTDGMILYVKVLKNLQKQQNYQNNMSLASS